MCFKFLGNVAFVVSFIHLSSISHYFSLPLFLILHSPPPIPRFSLFEFPLLSFPLLLFPFLSSFPLFFLSLDLFCISRSSESSNLCFKSLGNIWSLLFPLSSLTISFYSPPFKFQYSKKYRNSGLQFYPVKFQETRTLLKNLLVYSSLLSSFRSFLPCFILYFGLRPLSLSF